MPIYTRTGDKGKTSLFDGTRVSKAHVRVETYAAMDELNSVIGETIAFFPKNKLAEIKNELVSVQHDLFAIGSTLAMPSSLPVEGLETRTKEFEKMIDKLTAQIPVLKNFILPGGSKAGSLLHVCRTLTRRAERRLVTLMEQEDADERIVVYLNRLSDLFFTLARFVNHIEKKKEMKWIKK